MKDNGRIVFKFNCGNGGSQIETVERFNDGQWHTVRGEVLKNNTVICNVIYYTRSGGVGLLGCIGYFKM